MTSTIRRSLCWHAAQPVYISHPGLANGTGTELGLAVDAAKELEKDGKKCRVVSMVSWELYEEQDQQYKVIMFHKSLC